MLTRPDEKQNPRVTPIAGRPEDQHPNNPFAETAIHTRSGENSIRLPYFIFFDLFSKRTLSNLLERKAMLLVRTQGLASQQEDYFLKDNTP